MRGCDARKVLQPRQPVVATQSAGVLEQIERQAQCHGLGQDRQVNACDTAAKGKPAEHQREDARDQYNKGQLQDQTVREGPDQREVTAAHNAEYLVADACFDFFRCRG